MYESVHFIHGGKFTSRKEWKHPSRVIDSTELIIVTRGPIHIAVGEEDYTLKQGDVLCIPAGVVHGGTEASEEGVSFYWLHFFGIGEEMPLPTLSHPESIGQIEILCRQLLRYANAKEYPTECVDYLIRLLLIELSMEKKGTASTAYSVFSAAKEWVRANCDLPIKASDVAAFFHYNEDYLNRVFRRFYAPGLKAYIDEMKMQKIKRDLASDSLSLADVAAKYAFSDYKYFLKYFKYHEGVTPTKYRQLYHNIHINNN